MIWLLLTAGRGPGECQVAVAKLSKIVCTEAAGSGLDAEVIHSEDGPHGPVSTLIAIRGDSSSGFAQGWEGTLRWTCPSPLRKGHGRKNWYVGAAVLRPPEAGQELRSSDLDFETMRASGPGGQHVNKTESAVRLTHLPTGIAVVAREERSQHRNKALAVAKLAAQLAERERKSGANVETERWAHHNALERGNEVRAYEGEAFRRVR